MSNKLMPQIAITFASGGIVTGYLMSSVVGMDKAFMLSCWAWVSFTVGSAFFLWEWTRFNFLHISLIVVSLAFWNIWSDIENALGVGWEYYKIPDGKIRDIPSWLNDWVYYSIQGLIWGSFIYFSKKSLLKQY